MDSTCGPDSASWSSTAPSASSVLSSRCLGFMNAIASSYKREVETFLMMVFYLFESCFFLLLQKCVCSFLGSIAISPAQQRIHKMLGEVLDGINRVRVAVVTPYFYTVGEFWTVCLAKIFHQLCHWNTWRPLAHRQKIKVWCFFFVFCSSQILNAYWTDTCSRWPTANPAPCRCLTRFTGLPARS